VSTVGIPLFDTREQIEPLLPELERRVVSVMASGRFILGPEVQAFEDEFAAFLGTRHVIGVANGTDALTIALRALNIGEGDDVVVPSFTFYATAEAVVNAGARPVFCDIDIDTFCMTAETVAEALTPATRRVIPVHLFGMPAPMDDLARLAKERDLALIEDAAQAAGARLNGARVGALGDVATFSFFPSKNLFCLGDGGAIVTGDDRIAERARILRFHGSLDKRVHSDVGYNSRLDELQAAVLRVVLSHLDDWNERRRALARAYEDAGLGTLVSLPKTSPGVEPAYHLFVVRSPRRDELLDALKQAGIAARAYYEAPIHIQPAMARFGERPKLPATELAARTNLAVPMGPTRDPSLASVVIEALRQAVNSA